MAHKKLINSGVLQMEIRVAIFEDNKLVRDALQTILNGTPGYACSGAFTDGNRWDQDIRRSDPDVILMDIEMPGLNGIEITKRITEKFPEVKILIQTVFNDSDKIFNALCAGASGYILKSDPPHKYLEAINEVYNGVRRSVLPWQKNCLAFSVIRMLCW